MNAEHGPIPGSPRSSATRIGVPVFSYRGSAGLVRQLATQGFFTANLGDNMQTIAVRRVLERLGVPAPDTVSVDRDSLSCYDGPPVALVMNGVFTARCFPIPESVTPLFIGFCTSEATIVRYRGYFERFQPIGCRDTETAASFERQGIRAFVTGCLTLTLPERTPDIASEADSTLIVYGSGAGRLPPSLFKWIPQDRLERVEPIFHRLPFFGLPLDEHQRMSAEAYAGSLLDRYASTANLVVTPLHHVAAPCMALGIPVIICRESADTRFSYLEALSRVHTPGDFHEIDWSAPAIDLGRIKAGLELLLSEMISPFVFANDDQ